MTKNEEKNKKIEEERRINTLLEPPTPAQHRASCRFDPSRSSSTRRAQFFFLPLCVTQATPRHPLPGCIRKEKRKCLFLLISFARCCDFIDPSDHPSDTRLPALHRTDRVGLRSHQWARPWWNSRRAFNITTSFRRFMEMEARTTSAMEWGSKSLVCPSSSRRSPRNVRLALVNSTITPPLPNSCQVPLNFSRCSTFAMEASLRYGPVHP